MKPAPPQDQQWPQLYRYSVKIETTAKGLKMVTVHVYANDLETARSETIWLMAETTDGLKAQGFRTAELPNGD